jgi:hypothetical protein
VAKERNPKRNRFVVGESGGSKLGLRFRSALSGGPRFDACACLPLPRLDQTLPLSAYLSQKLLVHTVRCQIKNFDFRSNAIHQSAVFTLAPFTNGGAMILPTQGNARSVGFDIRGLPGYLGIIADLVNSLRDFSDCFTPYNNIRIL